MGTDIIRATRAGWFNFEGFGRPYEGWFFARDGWHTAGRSFTRAGAARKAKTALFSRLYGGGVRP